MPKTLRPRLLPVSIFVGAFLFAGCGQRTISVSGTTVFPSGVKIDHSDSVQIIFVPDDKEKATPLALFSHDDKSFVCKDIVPGAKYKISLRIEPLPTLADAQKRVATFEALNKTYDRAITTLKYQATEESSQVLAIDFAKSTVTATKK